MTKTLSSFRNQRNDLDKKQDIAVIGLACRFPGSESIEEFWASLCEGRFCIKDLSYQQASLRFFHSLSRQGGFLSEINLFDPDFFAIPSQETVEIDPLTRQVLLLVPKLFSNAGYTLQEIKGKNIGVFIGARAGTYSEKIAPFHKNSVAGLGQNFIAAYASQVFDLQGPSLVIDGACASSLLSIHLACQSLNSGECDLAIAGGVDLLLDDKPFDLLQASGALSARGRCAFFDNEADGIAIGEGVGLVLLKRYADALIDHNSISAVIEGSATNNDGRTMGITTPNPYQQERVIRSAIKNAAIDPRSICYIEAHGTGTMIGDPLELQALSRVFSREMMGTRKIGVGSVKSNLGHLLSAAGIASLIKVILSLQHKKIPASIHCIQKNPRFIFADSAFDLVQTLTPLEEGKEDYRAGVSAFGFGGTNVHLILRSYSGVTGRIGSLPPIAYHLRPYWPKKEDRFSTEGFDLSAQHPLLTDHTVQGRPVIPGVTYLSWISGKLVSDRALSHIVFEEPFSLRGENQARLELTFLNREAKITSKDAKTGKEITHLRAKWISASVPPLSELDIEKCKRGNIVSFQDLYQYAARVGISHGPFFKNRGQAYLTSNACLLEIQSPVSQGRSAFLPFDAPFDPALLDGATFAFIALFFSEFQTIQETFIPIAINHVHFFGTPTQVNYAYVQRSPSQKKSIFHDTYHHDIILYNELGRPIASLKGIVGKRIRKQWKEESSFQNQKTDPKPFHSFLLKKLKRYIPDLDLHALNEEQKFYEMGLDSKKLLDIVKELESEFSTSFYPTLLFEYDTLPALEVFLEQHVDVKPPFESYEQAARVQSRPFKDELTELSDKGDSKRSCFAYEESSSFKEGVLQTHSQLRSQEPSNREEPIAIIGAYGEYGPCKGLPSYWKALQEGIDCVGPVSDKRLKLWGISAEEASGYVGSWVEDIDLFEPGTFRLSPKELEGMDPQERKFLDCVQGCLEEASYKAEDLSATQKVGVFVGVMYGHYELFGREPLPANTRIPNSSYASIANRVSYVMDWQGPSIAIDTMCSSSLTAIHLACQSLKQGECEVAVAGGVNLHSHAQKFHWLKDTHFLSQNGRCRSFGKHQEGEQDGYVPGEGVGTVLLKPLSQAQKDGDYIWGVILGSAINHGGLAGGYTVPSPAAQQKVVEEAIKQAGINKEEISYIEAHGTGTSLGDPIEIKALQEAFLHPISIGSVKSNIGHLEAAAGIAGLTKILLQMHHKMLVPSLHSSIPNPYIDFSQLSLAVQQKLVPWVSSTGKPLTAGLSAFGAGGSNAHLILQEYRGNRLTKPLADRRERKSQMKSYWVTKAEKKVPLEAIPKELDEMRIYNVDWGLCPFDKTKSESSINSRLHFWGPGKSLFGIFPIPVLNDLKEDVDQIITFFEIKADQLGMERITHFLFESAKVLTTLKQQRIWSVVFQVERFEEDALLLAHLGFLKTLHLEHTFLKTRIVFVDKETLPLCFELLQEGSELPFCLRLGNQSLRSLHISPFQPAKKMKSSFLRTCSESFV